MKKNSFTIKKLIKSELGRKLVEAPPKSLSRIHPQIRKMIGSQLGYKEEKNN